MLNRLIGFALLFLFSSVAYGLFGNSGEISSGAGVSTPDETCPGCTHLTRVSTGRRFNRCIQSVGGWYCGCRIIQGNRWRCSRGLANIDRSDLSAPGPIFPVSYPCTVRSDGGGSGLFAARRRGRNGAHTGVDYFAPIGTPVISPYSGTVVTAADVGAAGNTIIVQTEGTPEPYRVSFFHLSQFSIGPGQRVSAGQQVGTVGRTGNADDFSSIRPHVHFEVETLSRRHIDPRTLGFPSHPQCPCHPLTGC